MLPQPGSVSCQLFDCRFRVDCRPLVPSSDAALLEARYKPLWKSGPSFVLDRDRDDYISEKAMTSPDGRCHNGACISIVVSNMRRTKRATFC